MIKSIDDIQKELDKFFNSEMGKLSDKKANQRDAQYRGGKTAWKKLVDSGKVIEMGTISAKKQWVENRDNLLIRSKMGGDKCKEEQKGIFNLTKEQLQNQGKKGYSNGLGKLSKQERIDIAKKAGKVSRDKNSKLKTEDVLYVRKVFIPRHNEFGVVPLSKKYGVTEEQCVQLLKENHSKMFKVF